MRFSRYRRRAKPSGYGRTLYRLAARLAPTAAQTARGLKQAIRMEARQADDKWQTGFRQFQERWPAHVPKPSDMARSYGHGGYFGRVAGRFIGGVADSLIPDSWRGNHRTKFAQLGAAIGDDVGDFVGRTVPYGDTIAAFAKPVAQTLLPGIFAAGSGAYSADGMDLGDMAQDSVQPMSFMDGEVDSVRIKKKEYLGAIAGSDLIAIRSLVLNAGDPATFPSLSRHAMNFEQYKMHGLIFWFKSTSGESTATASTNIGEVIMCSVSDSEEPVPTTKQHMLETDKPVTAKPSLSSCYGVECADSKVLRIRHGDPNEASADNTTFDMGRFFIGVEGANILSTRVGELWVSYDCTLIRSRDPRGLETLAFRQRFIKGTSALTGVRLFTFPSTNVVNSLKMEFPPLNPLSGLQNTFRFPSFLNDGTFVVILKLLGIGVKVPTPNCLIYQVAPLINGTANCTVTAVRRDQIQTPIIAGNSSFEGSTIGHYIVVINAPDSKQASVEFDGNSIWQNGIFGGTQAGTDLELEIYRIPDVAGTVLNLDNADN